MICSSKMLQNLPDFWNTKTRVVDILYIFFDKYSGIYQNDNEKKTRIWVFVYSKNDEHFTGTFLLGISIKLLFLEE